MGPVRQHADDLPGRAASSCTYTPAATPRSRLYEDEGDGYGYEDGAFSSIEVSWDDAARCLEIGERKGGFPGARLEREFAVTVHVGFDGEDGAGQPGGRTDTRRLRYAGQRVAVHWDAFPNAAPGITAVAVRR